MKTRIKPISKRQQATRKIFIGEPRQITTEEKFIEEVKKSYKPKKVSED